MRRWLHNICKRGANVIKYAARFIHIKSVSVLQKLPVFLGVKLLTKNMLSGALSG